MMYFILGSHPELSLAELKRVIGSDFQPKIYNETVLLHNPVNFELPYLQNRLGGIIKTGRTIGEMNTWNEEDAIALFSTLAQSAAGKNKISFGISVYNIDDPKATKQIQKNLDRLGLEIKKRVKETGRPVRYVKSKEPRLSSAVIQTNGLLESGGEFTIFVSKTHIWLGQTETIQNFKAWSHRDYGRPARDAKSGMLPPKLARMMINLSGVQPSKDSIILDPFCGSGTVLMEASLMGYHQIVGSDISEKAIFDTSKNMTWLVDQLDIPQPKLSLHMTPAAELPSLFSTPVDAIVTEVFLGKPRTTRVNKKIANDLIQELSPIFTSSFTALKSLLKPSGKIVAAFPAWKKEDGSWERLPLQNMLEELGYNIEDQFLYFRSNQFVARDIVIFK